jgi:probable rRNA maturation factor
MISITNLTKRKRPNIHWRKLAEKILGRKYDLSIVLADDALMKKLNKTYREKNKPADVLSFSFSAKQILRQNSGQGEIFINLDQKTHFPLFLFIHALLHLKGFKHSAKMKKREKKLLKKHAWKHSYRS